MATAKKKPTTKKPASTKKPAKARTSSAAKSTAPRKAVSKNTSRDPYTPRVQAMVYIFVVLAILFACLAFYRYP